MRKIELSLIIPAYNEEKIIKSTIDKVVKLLSKKKYVWELIVVDDGSVDITADLVKGFADKSKRIKLVRLERNRGKGAALRAGIARARGDYIIFSDADLSVDIKNVDRFLEVLKKGSDVVIGSRRVKGAKIAVHQPWLRESMGRVYTLLTQVVLTMRVADFTCGFKGFKKNAAKKIFAKSRIDRWAYDSEVLFLAKKFGYRIVQIPVTWRNRRDTRVVLRGVVFESFKDLLRIRLFDMQGGYT